MSRFVTKAALIGAAGALGALAFSIGPAQAAPTSTTRHDSFPAAGAVFGCASGDLTAVSGTVNQVFHTNTDPRGVFHVTGTITTQDVTLTDAAGNTYTLSSASWFGGKGAPDGSIIVSTDTAHFVIHSADGGVFAKVQLVEHFSPNGNTFSLDRGTLRRAPGLTKVPARAPATRSGLVPSAAGAATSR